MLTWRELGWISAFFGVVLLVLGPPIYSSQYPPTNQQTKRTGETQQNTKAAQKPIASPLPSSGQNNTGAESASGPRKEPNWFVRAFLDIKITDICLALFTGLLALYTGRLWTATSILSEADRPHMLLSHLKVSGITSPPGADGKVKVFIEFRIQNYGKNPAFLKHFSMVFDAYERLPPKPDYLIVQALRYVTAVGGWFGSLTPTTESVIGADEIRDFFLGVKTFFVFGMLEYSGIGGKTHKTRFAYRLVFSGGDASDRFDPDGPDSYWEYS